MWLVVIGALVVGVRWSIALAVLVWLAGYAASCSWRPFADCACCHGTGKHRSGKRVNKFRRCFWCGGRGSFYRLGRQVWNALRGRPLRPPAPMWRSSE
jgi:hypothetical protein